MNDARYHPRFWWIPECGIVFFACTYLLAAQLYSGGSQWDPRAGAFSVQHNFWCDLLRSQSWSGERNPGHLVALVGSVVLPLAMIPFWFAQARLFQTRWANRIVKFSGSFAMIAASLLPWAHDVALNVASFHVSIPLALVLFRLWRASDHKALALAVVASGFSLLNFMMWQLNFQQRAMPLVQILALTSSLLFILWTQRSARQAFLFPTAKMGTQARL